MKSIIVVGLGYGDEGKGTVVDALVRHHNAKLVIRYNGGFQAAHNVYTEDGVHHTFSQFGSGTLAGANTLIGRHVIINPLCMQVEAEALEKSLGVSNILDKVTVHESCIITTPYHRALNRVRELSRKVVHGSTGSGIGETVRAYLKGGCGTLRVNTIRNKNDLIYYLTEHAELMFLQCLELIHDYALNYGPDALLITAAMEPFYVPKGIGILADRYVDWANRVVLVDSDGFNEVMRSHKTVVFEGAQGVLLDQEYGFHPYTTWSDTTDQLAFLTLLSTDPRMTIGVTRTYMTRHGAGPFVTEFPYHTDRQLIKDDDNGFTQFTGNLRAGYPDLVALKYAIKCCKQVDAIALTHCDKLNTSGTDQICVAYEGADLLNYQAEEASIAAHVFTDRLKQTTPVYEDVTDLPTQLEKELKVPIIIKSFGKTFKNKVMGMPADAAFVAPKKATEAETAPVETPASTETQPDVTTSVVTEIATAVNS
jgi:adenylosuccinate synthase